MGMGIIEIYHMTPKTNCGKCGCSSCLNFATQVPMGLRTLKDCPYLIQQNFQNPQKTYPNTTVHSQTVTIKNGKISVSTSDGSSVSSSMKINCGECGYATCASFVRDLAFGKVSNTKCPYQFGSHFGMLDLTGLQTILPEQPIQYHSDEDQGEKTDVPEEEFDPNITMDEASAFFTKALNKANDQIKDLSLSEDLKKIAAITVDIYELVRSHPVLELQAKKFTQTYLPSVLKLINEYLSFSHSDQMNHEISLQKEKITATISKAKDAFLKLNDDLFLQVSFDIDAQIKSFDEMLTIDGLLNSQEMVMPEQDED